MASPALDPTTLHGICLALAGWLRYLVGKDDRGEEMPLSPDPRLAELQDAMKNVVPGSPESADSRLKPILEDATLYGVSLEDAGLEDKVLFNLQAMLQGPGAVRRTLHDQLISL